MSAPRPFPVPWARGLTLAAFVLGILRAWTRPVLSDDVFQLVRVGGAWLTGRLDPLAIPPGSHDAPILGAVATAAGAVFAGGDEFLARPTASLFFGIAAGLLVRLLLRSVDRAGVVFGLLLFLLPPAMVTSFGLRPDAALGGVLLLWALGRILADERRAGAGPVAIAWIATLATPIALPAALTVLLVPGPAGAARLRDPRRWVAPIAVVATWGLLAMTLPAGARGEMLFAALGRWDLSFGGVASSGAALRDVWVFGLLFVGPLLGPWLVRGAGIPRAVHLGWSLSALAAFALTGEDAFRAGSAALLPAACLLAARLVARIPDPKAAGGGPSRPLLVAFAIPLILLVFGEDPDKDVRRLATARSARLAQIGALLTEPGTPAGDILVRRPGAMTAYGDRPVRPIAGGSGDPGIGGERGAPGVIVLEGGRLPRGRLEERVYLDGRFLAGWAPYPVLRGPDRRRPDVIWSRREVEEGDSASETGIDPAYSRDLLNGVRAVERGHNPEAIRSLTSAADREPAPLGLAHEELGILLSRSGDMTGAIERFEAARRDPAASRARVRLGDFALSRKQLLRADSLLTEASRWSRATPALRAVRARLFALTGHVEEAMIESEAAVRLAPEDARTLCNHGTLLWRTGQPDAARVMWDRVVRIDADAIRFLGNYRQAPDSAPSPPLLPLYGPPTVDPGSSRGAP